jgi:hypothetical protein
MRTALPTGCMVRADQVARQDVRLRTSAGIKRENRQMSVDQETPGIAVHA